jgi:hypothetical protein
METFKSLNGVIAYCKVVNMANRKLNYDDLIGALANPDVSIQQRQGVVEAVAGKDTTFDTEVFRKLGGDQAAVSKLLRGGLVDESVANAAAEVAARRSATIGKYMAETGFNFGKFTSDIEGIGKGFEDGRKKAVGAVSSQFDAKYKPVLDAVKRSFKETWAGVMAEPEGTPEQMAAKAQLLGGVSEAYKKAAEVAGAARKQGLESLENMVNQGYTPLLEAAGNLSGQARGLQKAAKKGGIGAGTYAQAIALAGQGSEIGGSFKEFQASFKPGDAVPGIVGSLAKDVYGVAGGIEGAYKGAKAYEAAVKSGSKKVEGYATKPKE